MLTSYESTFSRVRQYKKSFISHIIFQNPHKHRWFRMWEMIFIPHLSLTYPSHQPSLFTVWHRIDVCERRCERLGRDEVRDEVRDIFSRIPCLCGFRGGQVRDERFFENSVKNTNQVRKLQHQIRKKCSQRGNISFPTREQYIPKLGTVCSTNGNVLLVIC